MRVSRTKINIMQNEKNIQQIICAYIRRYYPDVIFISDSSGLRVTPGLRVQMKKMRSSRGIPDLVILCPIGDYAGLMLEIKTDGTAITKRDGGIVADEHIREQFGLMMRLRNLGYAAFFVCGINAAVSCIEHYMRATSRFKQHGGNIQWMYDGLCDDRFMKMRIQ